MPEAAGELRAGLFRRMESLLLSALIATAISILCYAQEPTPLLLIWVIIDLSLNIVRFFIVMRISRRLGLLSRGAREVHSDSRIVDWFIGIGLVWCLQVGIGTGLCIATGNAAMGVFSSLLAMGTVGALSARNPAVPRLARLQMALIVLPFSVGALLSPNGAVHMIVFLAPMYLLGMVSINRQLHADYVSMIVARIENHRLAFHCSLTRLPNRSFFEQKVTIALSEANAAAGWIAVLCFDLDGFKRINDRFGHSKGDALLKEVATRIGHRLHHPSFLARLGGDEFAILMPNCSHADVRRMGRMALACFDESFVLDSLDVGKIGASIGIAKSRENGLDKFDDLLDRADQALYASKRTGKGRVTWYDDIDARVLDDQDASRVFSRATAGTSFAA